MNNEIRAIDFNTAEFRFADDDKRTLEGYASVFGVAADLGRFSETIERGAFTRALDEQQDVRALVEHDSGRVIGRTKNGTLELREDNRGLFTRIELPDTQDGRDMATLISMGYLDAMSFGFTVQRDRWEQVDGKQMRFIEDVDLMDVSVVAFPQYTSTEIALRSMPDEEFEYGEMLATDKIKNRFKLLTLGLKISSWGKQ